MGTYILPKNDHPNLVSVDVEPHVSFHPNDKTLGWALWHVGFNVSTVVRSKVT